MSYLFSCVFVNSHTTFSIALYQFCIATPECLCLFQAFVSYWQSVLQKVALKKLCKHINLSILL